MMKGNIRAGETEIESPQAESQILITGQYQTVCTTSA